jgi:hypothetical protein
MCCLNCLMNPRCWGTQQHANSNQGLGAWLLAVNLGGLCAVHLPQDLAHLLLWRLGLLAG